MTNKKLILEAYIKKAVQKTLKEQEEKEKSAEKAIFLIYRFPKLKELMDDLMSPAFGRFIASIKIIAPKPTVFNIELINGQEFDITYIGSNKFRIRISGKKYYPANIGELERASQSIADLLLLSKPDPNMAQQQQAQYDQGLANDLGGGSGGGSFSGGNFPDGGGPEPAQPGDAPLDGDSEIPANTPEEDEELLAQSRAQNPQ
jgi:uncharacterized membrane protein YgcG